MTQDNRWKPKRYSAGTALAAGGTAPADGTKSYLQRKPDDFIPLSTPVVATPVAATPADIAAEQPAAARQDVPRLRRFAERLRRLPMAYLAAWSLFLLLLLTALLGTRLMPHSIGDGAKFQYRQVTEGGQPVYIIPPVRPNGEFWLGTDHRGIDLLSLLLNGMKLTLGFAASIALCRFLFGIPLGLWGAGSRAGRGFIRVLQLVTASVPALILLYPVLIGFYRLLNLGMVLPDQEWKRTLFSLLLFASASFLGIASVADQTAERGRFFLAKDYVAAARLMGAGRLRIARRHILPALAPELLYMLLSEWVQVLFLLGQLAVLGIFLGGSETVNLEDGMPLIQQSPVGEWGAMISYGARFIQFYPHILLGAGLFFIVSVAVLKFFLAQLQKRGMRIREEL